MTAHNDQQPLWHLSGLSPVPGPGSSSRHQQDVGMDRQHLRPGPGAPAARASLRWTGRASPAVPWKHCISGLSPGLTTGAHWGTSRVSLGARVAAASASVCCHWAPGPSLEVQRVPVTGFQSRHKHVSRHPNTPEWWGRSGEPRSQASSAHLGERGQAQETLLCPRRTPVAWAACQRHANSTDTQGSRPSQSWRGGQRRLQNRPRPV